MLRTYWFLAAVALGVLIIDQASKAWVVTALRDGRSYSLLGGAVRIVDASNTGAAFSMFRTGGVIFGVVAAAVSLGIIWYYPRVTEAHPTFRFALGLVLGGALGNLVDRVRLGHVVDFIDLGWWPVFNLADSAVVLGVALLVMISLTRVEREPA